MGLHEIKNFCTTKEKVFKLKRPPTEWEKNICQLYIRQRTGNPNIQEAQKIKLPQINELIKKRATELNRMYSKEEIQMAKKHMKKCSPSLAVTEMQIKTKLRFCFTPVRIAFIKNTTNKKCLQGCGEKGTLLLCW
jgi:hypothetical protein